MNIMHASRSIESTRPLTNDELRALWASRFYMRGHHRNPDLIADHRALPDLSPDELEQWEQETCK
jgi:hypothetical protein